MTLFSERLKEERVRLRYGQGEFAKLAGVNRRSQINYEKGERSPNADYLLAVSAIEVDITYLLTGKRIDGAVSDKLTEALQLSRDMEPGGGELTDLSVESFHKEANNVAEAKPSYLSAREQSLLDNYRASSEDAKQAMETTAKIMANKAKEASKGS